jgi:Calx-beta domain
MGSGVISVDYATSDNTTTAGSDYGAVSGTLDFATGEVSKSFTIPITNDNVAEGNESLNLTLSSLSGTEQLGPNRRAVLIITDDDVYTPPTLLFSDVNFAGPESTATKTITVSRTGDNTGTVSVNWSAASNTATLGTDFTAPGGVLTFGPGVTSQSFTVNITNDTAAEGNESGHLILSNPTGGAKLGSRPRAILTISDNDVSSSGFKFNNNSYTTTESGSKSITITRTSSTAAQSVTFTTSNNGTAVAGADYTAVTSTVNFAINETSKTVSVPILSDSIVESNESVNLTLSNPTGGGTLGTLRTSVLFITDNDTNGTLQFKVTSYSVSESGPTATITVTRTGGTYGVVDVSYATTNNTATKGLDYTNTTGTLSFTQGQSSKSFTIPILNDTSLEGAESLNLTLSNPTGGATLGQGRRAVLIITDND